MDFDAVFSIVTVIKRKVYRCTIDANYSRKTLIMFLMYCINKHIFGANIRNRLNRIRWIKTTVLYGPPNKCFID